MSGVVYTIGHSNGTVERLVGLLRLHAITAVADVRSQPYSRFNPQFNRETLAIELKNSGLEYVFLGQELGARSEDPACYRKGRAQYSLIARTAVFERGIQRLLAGMDRFQVTLMCAEKEPLACHRSILISRSLQERGVRVRHILEDGSVEDHETSLLRLLELHGMQDTHLFHSRDELIAIAYEKQAEEIEYSASQSSQPA
ncbi:MAG TPA: DUF488 domain-containing protein [Candidatus Udaeobacter sp.]|nr:DUF488 domain-containing protein [Candidatus Udaeobacter sp.]